MRAWITIRWLALIHFVHAVDRVATSNGTNISSSGLTSSTSSSNYGASSVTATSNVTKGSLPGNASRTSVASSPSTQTQVNIPIKPTTFSPFPVPSDNPISPNYPVVDPSQPPSVSYTRHWLLLELTRSNHIFIGGLLWHPRFRTCVGSRIR